MQKIWTRGRLSKGQTSQKSVIEFKFPAQAANEGGTLCRAVGHDMISLDGYLNHEASQDAKDPGHFMVNTL